MKVREVDHDSKCGADLTSEECKTNFSKIKTVDWRENEREDFEEGVVDTVEEGGIYVDEEDGRVFDRDFNGLDKGVDEDTGCCQVTLIDLAPGLEVLNLQ